MSEAAARKVLVTRAEPGATQTARRLSQMGLVPIVSPVLQLQARDTPVPDFSVFGGLVFTSANGVRFFAEASSDRSLPAWCVGPATAAQALREGFSPVHESSGDAHDLAHYIAHHWHGADKALLHVANSAAKGNLKTALEDAGFSVTFLPLYEARPAPALSEDARRAIASGETLICLVHSQKAAEAFAGLAKGLDLAKTKIVAISAQAGAPLQDLGTGDIHIADHPDEAHLLGLLKGLLAGG